jgi:hypothetical protein
LARHALRCGEEGAAGREDSCCFAGAFKAGVIAVKDWPPGSLLTALGAVERNGRVHWSGAQYSDARLSKYVVGAARMVVER